jgi:hypothetical protein
MTITEALTYYNEQKSALADAVTETKSPYHIWALHVSTAVMMRRQALLSGIGRQYRDDNLIAALKQWRAVTESEV